MFAMYNSFNFIIFYYTHYDVDLTYNFNELTVHGPIFTLSLFFPSVPIVFDYIIKDVKQILAIIRRDT